MHRRSAALLLLLPLLATACARATPPAPDGAAPVPAVAEVRSDADIRLPFDAHVLTAAQQRTVILAEQRLARGCMSRFGLDWPAPVLPPVPDAPANSRRYGVLDPASAGRLGYHPPADPPAAPAPATTPEMLTVYGGKGGPSELDGRPVPEGGCLGEARRGLGIGEFSLGSLELNRIGTDSFTQAQQDPRYTAATAAWSSCMQRAGHSYADIWRANNDPRWSVPAPTELELATARADAACKLSTRLPTVLLTVETELQTAAIHRRAAALRTATERQHTVLARATAVLARP
ncbi:hypothetical protein ACIA8O_18020 [Kitasatospora sp. NPDC051853]|uniref:hypothetical protein n=1 Tax=Kitasatospora sp. NPDC051853 TaxID=3364058 RepID=UPI0037B7A688